MSYDLQVFAQQSLSNDAVRELVAEAGLVVDASDGDASTLSIARGAKGKYSFTLGMPVSVESEDVPEEVTAMLLAPSFMYELMVEGSSATEIPHAVRFARRLAAAGSGVVLDQQTGKIWAGGKLRTPPSVERGLIDVVDVVWYAFGSEDGRQAARAWLDSVRRHLPEALPRRFGPVEPLAMKFDMDGQDGFLLAVAAESSRALSSNVYFKGSSPCIGGSIAGGVGTRTVVSHQLSLHREALHDPRWRDGLRRLFIGFADRADAFFASAEVRRGVTWSGRAVSFGPEAEKTTYLAPRGRWAGLLPYPPWWAWFGPEYEPLVATRLPSEQVRSAGGGLFHWRGEEPQDRDQLTAQASGASDSDKWPWGLRDLLSRRNEPRDGRQARWLPSDLLASVDDSEPNLHNPPLVRAETMPAGLQ